MKRSEQDPLQLPYSRLLLRLGDESSFTLGGSVLLHAISVDMVGWICGLKCSMNGATSATPALISRFLRYAW